MKNLYKFILIIFLSLNFINISHANESHFLDFSAVLNKSKAGKEAQEFLKNKIEKDGVKYKSIEENLLKKEREIIAKKNVISNDEYKKQITELRKEVSKLQKDKQNSLNDIAKLRLQGRKKLIETLNPILKQYMQEKKITLVLDKKIVVLGNSSLDITNDLIIILDKKLKSLNLK